MEEGGARGYDSAYVAPNANPDLHFSAGWLPVIVLSRLFNLLFYIGLIVLRRGII